MANPERGEIDFEIGDRAYTFKLGTQAMREIEAKLSTPGVRVKFGDAIQGAMSGDVTYMTTVVWGTLRKYHPEIGIPNVEDLVDACGGYLPFLKTITPLLTFLLDRTQPDPRDRAVLEDAGPDRPLDAAPAQAPAVTPTIGTGPRSTAKRARLA